MNSVTPYEILIAQKVEQAAVPDMADMADNIWASIQAELDTDTPPDEGNEPPANTPPGKGLPGISKVLYFFTIAAVVTIAIWFFSGNKKDTPDKTQEPESLPAIETVEPAADSRQLIDRPGEKHIQPLQTIKTSKDPTDINYDGNNLPDNIDSANNLILPDNGIDSAAFTNDNTGLPVIDTSTITPPVKKPKGVKGIGVDDYKIISGKKDSAKKG